MNVFQSQIGNFNSLLFEILLSEICFCDSGSVMIGPVLLFIVLTPTVRRKYDTRKEAYKIKVGLRSVGLQDVSLESTCSGLKLKVKGYFNRLFYGSGVRVLGLGLRIDGVGFKDRCVVKGFWQKDESPAQNCNIPERWVWIVP